MAMGSIPIRGISRTLFRRRFCLVSSVGRAFASYSSEVRARADLLFCSFFRAERENRADGTKMFLKMFFFSCVWRKEKNAFFFFNE